MKSIKVEIKKEKNLSKDFIKFWNKTMFNTFMSKPMKNFEKDLFFVVKDNNQIVALATLVPVKIEYLSKNYDILGIGDVTSLIRKRGYGKILVESIKRYTQKNKKTALGFTHNTRIAFYEKCGIKIKKRMTKKFFYIGKNKEAKKYARFYSRCNPVVIYLEGKDNFMKTLLKNKERVELPIQFW